MKPPARILIFTLIMNLLVACPALAQDEGQSQKTEDLKAKLEKVERIDISSLSPSMQIIYKSSRQKLYGQIVAALRRDIENLKVLQSVQTADSAPQGEIAAEIQKLVREQSAWAEKFQAISNDLIESASVRASHPQAPPTTPEVPLTNAVYRPRTITSQPETLADGSTSVSAMPASDSITNGSPQDAGAKTKGDPPDISKVEPPVEGDTKLKGKAGAATKDATVTAYIDGAAVSQLATASSDGSFIVYLPAALTPGKDIKFTQKVNGTESTISPAMTSISKKKKEEQEAEEAASFKAQGPVALAVGGSVISNQAQKFSQADPFFGFIAGYASKDKGHNGRGGQFNFRFEGLFESAPERLRLRQ